MLPNIFFILLSLTIQGPAVGARAVYLTREGHVSFLSDAPLELIRASSGVLNGAVDTGQRTFAFTVEIKSFDGFNSPLQREHFFENYMEADRFPRATFTGRIIEKVDLSRDGEYIIRAKGRLKIHGVERERIIRSQVTTRGEKMHIVSEFTVGLREHNISVPKIVFQKIAREIKVRVEADLVR